MQKTKQLMRTAALGLALVIAANACAYNEGNHCKGEKTAAAPSGWDAFVTALRGWLLIHY